MLEFRKRFAKRKWDCRRFGITPKGVYRRFKPGDVPPVVAISIPKAGTHLTESILCRHPLYYRRLTRTIWGSEGARLRKHLSRALPGQVLITHSYFSKELAGAIDDAGARIVFTVRDPRDVLLSDAHYIYSNKSHPLHSQFRHLTDTNDRAMLLIEGDRDAGIVPFPDLLQQFVGWLETSAVVIHYEDVIGNDTSRLHVVHRLFHRLGAPLPDRVLQKISSNVVSQSSPTFRRGRIGDWRSELSPEVISALTISAPDQLVRFGHAMDIGT